MAGEIVSALRDAAAANPEKAMEVVSQLKDKYNSLSPEEKEQVRQTLGELRDKAANLTDEQRTQIAEAIRNAS